MSESYRGLERLSCRMAMLDSRIKWNKHTTYLSWECIGLSIINSQEPINNS